MWVFRKSIFDNQKMRPTNDGMPLSEEIKILARSTLASQKPSKSQCHIVQELVMLRFTLGETVGKISNFCLLNA